MVSDNSTARLRGFIVAPGNVITRGARSPVT